MKRDFITMFDLKKEEIHDIFELAKTLKDSQKKGVEHRILKNKTLAMVFEKPSLRTRVTFETGMTQLGGHAIYLAPSDIQLGTRETVPDAAKNLSRWVDIVMARVFAHKTVDDLAKSSSIPVINGLSDLEHPCQIMADLFTVSEKTGPLDGLTIAYVGDGNNVCNSFVAASILLGFSLRIATPAGYEPEKTYTEKAANAVLSNDPIEAVAEADIVYTDVWASMGQEKEAAERKNVFKKFQLNADLLMHAKKDHLVMHCLPAHRGEEITDVQKSIMVWLSQQH
jgi:ornithine carbamoyltransferase